MTRLHAYAALAVLSALAAGCSKPAPTTTTTVRTAAAPAQRTINVSMAPPPSATIPALATGPGVSGDTAKTAAVTAPANSNGTIPPHGVDPPPSR